MNAYAPVESVVVLERTKQGVPMVEGRDQDWATLLEGASDTCPAEELPAEQLLFLLYTSGTTGPPKGALHAHRVIAGHLPCVQFSHDFFPQPGDVMWTPADWAWIGGLINIMFASLFLGVPVVAHRFEKFDAERAYALMAELKVRNTFLPPTALKMLRASGQSVNTTTITC